MPRQQQRGPIQTSPGLLQIRKTLGMQAALARHLNVTRQAIYDWPVVPIARLIEVEEFTGIPRELLRPDIFLKRMSQRLRRAGDECGKGQSVGDTKIRR